MWGTIALNLCVQGNTHNDYLNSVTVRYESETAFTIEARLFITHSLTAHRSPNTQPIHYIIVNRHTALGVYNGKT